MRMKNNLADAFLLDLHLFDGGAAGAGAATGATAPAAGEQTGVAVTPDAGETPQEATQNPEDRDAKFRELITGEYREQYGKEVQQIINKRIKDSKALEQRISDQQGIIDRLNQRYGIDDGNLQALGDAIDHDYTLWSDAADEAGMTTEQYVKFQALQRQNADLIRQEQARAEAMQQQQRIQRWMGEAENIKKTFPGFNLEAELANPAFGNLLKSGVPMEHAYKVVHFDEIQNATVQVAAQRTEKAVTDNIRAKGTRPSENGAMGGHGASEITTDVHKITKQERDEYIRRARNGERITFNR